jgi:hypothetical protein
MRIPEDEDALRRGYRWLKIISQDIAFKGLDRRKDARITKVSFKMRSRYAVEDV